MPRMAMKKKVTKKVKKTFTKMTEDEVRLARRWFVEDDIQPSEIAERLGRDKSTLTRLLVKRRTLKKQGPRRR